MPLASVVEDEYQVLNKEGDHIRDVKKSINEQKFVCRFGKYGETESEFINRTDIICLTPKFNTEDEIKAFLNIIQQKCILYSIYLIQ